MKDASTKTLATIRLKPKCYLALGLLMAYWILRRKPAADPVARLRSSGGL